MKYSIIIDREQVALAHAMDINVSYKDLTVVCDAIRYLKTDAAFEVLLGIVNLQRPILFTKFNTHMGSRHELGGRKGAYPIKAAMEINKILMNAVANSRSKGLDESSLYIVHASANKTRIERRTPSKGSQSWGRGMYGLSARTHSDIEFAKIEIGVANADAASLTDNMKRMIRVRNPVRLTKAKPKETKSKEAKPKETKAKEKPAVKQEASATVKK